MQTQVNNEELQSQQKLVQRRRNLQQWLLEQKSVAKEVRQQQHTPDHPEALRLGRAPLDTGRIAVFGVSVGSMQKKTVWVGGFSVSWVDNVSPPQVSSYVCLFGGNFYPELLALKSALDACPPNEPLTILTQSGQLQTFINNAKNKGKRKVLTEQLEKTLREMIDARPARVQAVESKGEWVKTIQKYASKLAMGARKLREEEDPSLPPEQQAVLDATLQQKEPDTPPVPTQPTAMSQAPVQAPRQQAPSQPASPQVPQRYSSAQASKPSIPPSRPISHPYETRLVASAKRIVEASAAKSSSPSMRPTPPSYQERASTKRVEVPQKPSATYTRPVTQPSQRPSRTFAALGHMYSSQYVPPHSFSRMPPPPPFQPMFPYASQSRVSPPPSLRAISRAGSSQPSVPISRSDMRSAVTPVRDSAADLSGNPLTQAASGAGSNSQNSDTPWIVPERPSSPVDRIAKATVDVVAKRLSESKSKQNALKRRRSEDEGGESDGIAKKVKPSVASDEEDEEFYDAEEGQRGWSSWLGKMAKKFL